MSTDPAQVRMDTIREQAAEFDEYDSRAKALLAFRCNGQVITGGELVHSYACPMHPETTANKPGVPFGVVDAAREDLAAELARVTAERDQARAHIRDLDAAIGVYEKFFAEWEATPHDGEWVTEYRPSIDHWWQRERQHRDTHQRRVWYGPPTPISDTE